MKNIPCAAVIPQPAQRMLTYSVAFVFAFSLIRNYRSSKATAIDETQITVTQAHTTM